MSIGKIIQNRYQIEDVLGQGSMGTTYKALDLKTQHPVAVKLLHFSRVQEWKALEMFEREAKILQQLDHPRIPSYIDYFSSETPSDVEFLLVQEYIEGKTLQHLVEKGWRGTEAEILDIFWQLVNILAYLHTLKPPVIHRDINPKNILLSSLNEVFLVDFGAVQERIRTTFLGGSTIVGTYGYVPFEQFSGHTVPASDYYALGATLLYMLSHRHPADFAADDTKPQFHDSLQASPKIVRLLDGLLEPSVKQRVASPDQIKAILAGKPGGLVVESQKLSKPPKTKIKKIVKGDAHIRFQFPCEPDPDIVRKIVLWSTLPFVGSVVLIMILTYIIDMILPDVIGFLYFGTLFLWIVAMITICVSNQRVIELTPEWIQIYDRFWGMRERLPTASIRPSNIIQYIGKPGNIPVIGINHQGKTVEIGRNLTQVEMEWLTQEINEYISTSAKPLQSLQSLLKNLGIEE